MLTRRRESVRQGGYARQGTVNLRQADILKRSNAMRKARQNRACLQYCTAIRDAFDNKGCEWPSSVIVAEDQLRISGDPFRCDLDPS